MKKFLLTLLCALTLAFTAFGLAACTPAETGKISVYAPDGAPALSIARLMSDETLLNGRGEYKIVPATTIQTYVNGENPAADVCILPVNAASKLLGSAKTYQMLGTVTHGNLFLLKKAAGEDITLQNLSSLKGKTVGVINLANVPGLTFKAILNDNQIAYTELGNDGVIDSEKVNLKALADGTEVTPAATCDYFVVPEPAATTKVNATQGKLLVAASLQTLYGGQNGYPQAVVVAKKDVIKNNPKFISDLISSFKENANWLKTATAETIVNAVTAHLPEGSTPTFTAKNLNATVIENCGINFVSAKEGKAEVLAYLAKLNAISNNNWGTPANEFFYS
ncbi:MAG: hypothetical protein J6B04_05990 [Clostridia bacterium]|nr:hypothetical protein [Clostridia bacterium]